MTYDVAIVGARAAGAATALLLARAGLSVIVLDRARRGSDTLSTHALMRAGVLQLSRWGVLDDVVASGAPPVQRTIFHYRDSEPVTVSIRPSPGVPALFAPRRHELDEILVRAAVAAGADVRHRTPVVGLLRDDRGRVTGVRFRDERGTTRTVAATITVGADGAWSLVAREAGAEVTARGRSASAILYGYAEHLPVSGYEWAYGAGAGAGLVPTNDGRTCVFASSSPQTMRAARTDGADAAFLRLLRAASPVLAERVTDAPPVDMLRGWRGEIGHVRRAFGPGWALVGDAGMYRDPISSHGITDAFRDAELLSGAIVEILSGGAPEVVALGAYQAVRDRMSRRMFDLSDEIAGYDWSPQRLRDLLRAHSSAMSDEMDLLSALPPPLSVGSHLVAAAHRR